MAIIGTERVLAVRHWTDTQFTFSTTRDRSMRFDNGQFVMVGLMLERPLLRAYSIASANHADHLEFLSVKVPDGPLTSRLQHVQPGDEILVSRKPTGTLLLADLRPGARLYLLCTGTGAAPFLSIIQDPELYARFAEVILVHGVRWARETEVVRQRIAALRKHDAARVGPSAAGPAAATARSRRRPAHGVRKPGAPQRCVRAARCAWLHAITPHGRAGRLPHRAGVRHARPFVAGQASLRRMLLGPLRMRLLRMLLVLVLRRGRPRCGCS